MHIKQFKLIVHHPHIKHIHTIKPTNSDEKTIDEFAFKHITVLIKAFAGVLSDQTWAISDNTTWHWPDYFHCNHLQISKHDFRVSENHSLGHKREWGRREWESTFKHKMQPFFLFFSLSQFTCCCWLVRRSSGILDNLYFFGGTLDRFW